MSLSARRQDMVNKMRDCFAKSARNDKKDMEVLKCLTTVLSLELIKRL